MILPHSYTLVDSPLLLGQAKQAELGTVIRCLVWNIWKARRRGWLEEFSHLIKDRDLVILQEAVY